MGYTLGASFYITALLKPFFPHNVGVFIEQGLNIARFRIRLQEPKSLAFITFPWLSSLDSVYPWHHAGNTFCSQAFRKTKTESRRHGCCRLDVLFVCRRVCPRIARRLSSHPAGP